MKLALIYIQLYEKAEVKEENLATSKAHRRGPITV